MNKNKSRGLTLFIAACILALSNVEGARGRRVALPLSQPSAYLPGPTDAARVISLCGKDERVVFSCAITGNQKLLSLCRSQQLDANVGYVQYRFGRPGRIELEFPKGRKNTQSAFRYTRYTRPLVTYLTLRFEMGGYLYSVHQDSDDEQKPRVAEATVTVAPVGRPEGDAKQVELRCRMPVEGSLMKLEDIVTTRPWPDEEPTQP